MGKPGAYLEVSRREHAMRDDRSYEKRPREDCRRTVAPLTAREQPGPWLHDFEELAVPLSCEEQRVQASRCMYCGVAFCQTGESFGAARASGCPLHNLIPEWNDLMWRGLWDDAVERLSLTNPFPEFTGRVCPALCEAACNLGLNDEPTTIRDNERALSDYAWAREGGPLAGAVGGRVAAGCGGGSLAGAIGWGVSTGCGDESLAGAAADKTTAGAVANDALLLSAGDKSIEDKGTEDEGTDDGCAPKVAVVGSGPAGLACAWELARRGMRVTLVERADRAGGLLMYGIPNMKLPKDVVTRRVELMQACGIDVQCSTDASRQEVVDELRASNDALVIAVGARRARRLSVPGAELAGVVPAVEYLSGVTKKLLDAGASAEAAGTSRSFVDANGLDVVVIGGGDTGTDCVATALRQGAAGVTQLEFLPSPPVERATGDVWPQWPNVRKDDYGQREAAEVFGHDPRQWGVETLEVLGEEGRVSGLRIVSLDWSGGKPERVAGTERVIPAQLVLLAMGFVGPERGVFDAFGVVCDDARGLPVVVAGSHRCVVDVGVGPDAGAGPDAVADSVVDVPVFAAGDCRSGSSLVVSSIADGIACAREVITALS